ncbi:Kinesin-like protein kif19, partial [Blyttiomyces sp. JEL0837]
MSLKEQKEGALPVAKALDEHTVLVIDPSEDFTDVLRQDRPREKLYTFEHVFSETVDQLEVFEKTTKFLIATVLKGYNATVFAYGATGAGKTHTMLGTETNPGIMGLTLAYLFEQISAQDDPDNFEVTLSYLEIYNENIRDLLSGKADYLDLREDYSRGVVVAGITTVSVKSADEILSMLRRGNKSRTQEATGANEVSSRSHAVLQIFICYKDMDKHGHVTERFGKLSMIDLAGSERAADTKNRGMRMIEGANINRSLLALGNCINALGDNKKGKYVNYRDSKLTRLLKDSLGGNCRTVMIANISPASTNFEETSNTLKYASRARNIKTRVIQQESHKFEPYNAALYQLQSDIGDLKSRLAEAQVEAKQRTIRAASRERGDTRPFTAQNRSRAASNPVPKHYAEMGVERSKGGNMAYGRIVDARTQLAVTPGGVENSMFTELRATLNHLFSEHMEVRKKIVESDEEKVSTAIKIGTKAAEIAALERKIGELGVADEEKKSALQMEVTKIRAEFSKFENQKKACIADRSSLEKQIVDIDDKIKNIHQTLPRSLDKRSRQCLDLLIKKHFSDMDNLDLMLKFSHSMTALKQKELELNSLYHQLSLFDNIASTQKELISKAQLEIPQQLVHFYDEINQVIEDDDKVKSTAVAAAVTELDALAKGIQAQKDENELDGSEPDTKRYYKRGRSLPRSLRGAGASVSTLAAAGNKSRRKSASKRDAERSKSVSSAEDYLSSDADRGGKGRGESQVKGHKGDRGRTKGEDTDNEVESQPLKKKKGRSKSRNRLAEEEDEVKEEIEAMSDPEAEFGEIKEMRSNEGQHRKSRKHSKQVHHELEITTSNESLQSLQSNNQNTHNSRSKRTTTPPTDSFEQITSPPPPPSQSQSTTRHHSKHHDRDRGRDHENRDNQNQPPSRHHSKSTKPNVIDASELSGGNSMGNITKQKQSSHATTIREAREEIQRGVREAREERLRAKRDAENYNDRDRDYRGDRDREPPPSLPPKRKQQQHGGGGDRDRNGNGKNNNESYPITDKRIQEMRSAYGVAGGPKNNSGRRGQIPDS